MVCQLRASEQTLVDRIERREIGTGLERHRKRAIELARSLALSGPADVTVETDHRALADIVDDILRRTGLVLG